FPGRVDVAIPDLERGGNDFAAIAQGGGAEADGGDLGAVRGEGGDGGWSHGREREGGAHSTIRLSTVNRTGAPDPPRQQQEPRLRRRGLPGLGEPMAFGKSIKQGCAPRRRWARAARSRGPTPSRCSSCRSRRWRASCAACR